MATNSIVLATGNQGKITEFKMLLSGVNVNWLPQGQLGVSDIEETGTTFRANALLKAQHASQVTGLPALADDSGLEVEALGGDPGIFSARYSGEHGNNQANIAKVISELTKLGLTESPARYVCSLALTAGPNDRHPTIVEEYLDGVVVTNAQGEHGFGYDPIFFLPSEGKTVAELEYNHKQSISHRAKAIRLIYQYLSSDCT